jgi:hypothetical protein
MTWPRIHWFGSGFGHSGSTSKRGAVTRAPFAPASFRGGSAEFAAVAAHSTVASRNKPRLHAFRYLGFRTLALILAERQHNPVILFVKRCSDFCWPQRAWSAVTAHDIPQRRHRSLARAAGRRPLQLLVRVPLRAMRDAEFPAQSSGYLDVAKLAPILPGLATTWIRAVGRTLRGTAPG